MTQTMWNLVAQTVGEEAAALVGKETVVPQIGGGAGKEQGGTQHVEKEGAP